MTKRGFTRPPNARSSPEKTSPIGVNVTHVYNPLKIRSGIYTNDHHHRIQSDSSSF